MLICLRLLDKLVHLVVVLLFLLLLSLPLLSAALTFTVTGVCPPAVTGVCPPAVTGVCPAIILLVCSTILLSDSVSLLLFQVGILAWWTGSPLRQWALHTNPLSRILI